MAGLETHRRGDEPTNRGIANDEGYSAFEAPARLRFAARPPPDPLTFATARRGTCQNPAMPRRVTRADPELARAIPVSEVSAGVEAWFPSAARDLPWRRGRTPWRALVGELMLQQTQVSRVAERFESFMTRFPTPAAMVEAGEDEVLAAWEGMGYYRRARLLHAAAVRIVERHGGEVPDDPEAILDLPGVGRYTAGAVASIVFGRREPIVDGNVVRVVARLAAVDARADDPSLVASAWRAAEALVSAAHDPGVLNEGLMELGATVCTPANPRCEACPCREQCAAGGRERASAFPRPKTRPTRTIVHLHLVLLTRAGRIAVEQRPRRGLWGGLWQPPGLEASSCPTAEEVIDGLVEREVLTEAGRRSASLVERARVRRLLTHREVHLVLHELRKATPRASAPGLEWCDRDAAADLGMARPVRDLVEAHGWTD